MLLQAGASNVISIAMARNGTSYKKTLIRKAWNPFEPCDLDEDDIQSMEEHGNCSIEIDEYFLNSVWKFYLSLS